jgi:hypothetical protein
VGTLTLQIRYDDGFVGYLNGVEIARRSAPEPPLWNSIATEERPDTSAVVLTDIDVTSSASLLRDGTNILAIHALNRAVDDDDLLMAARLKASSIPALAERYFPNPTLGHSNSAAYLGVVADTKFSVDRGFYNAPFVLHLTNATPGAAIRFTLDGSPPSPVAGLLYTGPLPINKTTTLRAASFKPGYQPSDIDTHTYIFIEDVLRQNASTASARRFPPPGAMVGRLRKWTRSLAWTITSRTLCGYHPRYSYERPGTVPGHETSHDFLAPARNLSQPELMERRRTADSPCHLP